MFYFQLKLFWINILKKIHNSLSLLIGQGSSVNVPVLLHANSLDNSREIKLLMYFDSKK